MPLTGGGEALDLLTGVVIGAVKWVEREGGVDRVVEIEWQSLGEGAS